MVADSSHRVEKFENARACVGLLRCWVEIHATTEIKFFFSYSYLSLKKFSFLKLQFFRSYFQAIFKKNIL